jgi:hypothetical protein
MPKKSKLTLYDYKRILEFYEVDIPSSKSALKSIAEDLISTKMCKCINHLKSNKNCSKTIFNKRGKFHCSKKRILKNKTQRTT